MTSADECCTDDATQMTPASVQPSHEVVAAAASRNATVKAAVVSTCGGDAGASQRGLNRSMMRVRPPPYGRLRAVSSSRLVLSGSVRSSVAADWQRVTAVTANDGLARSFKVLGLGETVDLPWTQILPSLPSLPSLRHPLAISRILSSCKYSILLIYLSVLYVLIKHVSGK